MAPFRQFHERGDPVSDIAASLLRAPGYALRVSLVSMVRMTS